MIPSFTDEGILPPGIHEASLEEIELRFTGTIKRKKLFEGLKLLIQDLKSFGCKAIYIDGSYVTDKSFPNDIDICWDNRGVDYTLALSKMPVLNDRKMLKNKYGCDVFQAFIIERSSGIYFIDFFQKNRDGNEKGIIKLKL